MYEMEQPTEKEEQKKWEYNVIENIKVEYENSNEPATEVKNCIEVKQESFDRNWTETSDNLNATNFDLCPPVKCELSSADCPQILRSSAETSATAYNIEIYLQPHLKPENVTKTNDNFEINTGKRSHLNYENKESFSINVNDPTTNENDINENKNEKKRKKKIKGIKEKNHIQSVSENSKGKYEGLLGKQLFIYDTNSQGQASLKKIKLLNESSVHEKKKAEKSFSCVYCDRKFERKNGLRSHMVTHTDERPFSCKQCDYRCGCKSNLIRHMRIHTGEKPFACDSCDYKCADMSSLVNHKKAGGKCSQHNNYKYKKKGLFLGDTLIDDKPFSCDHCSYKCANKTRLTCHMRTHSGEKPFSCHLCDYKGGHKCSLVRHMLIHTGDKPFLCDICNRQFGRKASLMRHNSLHSGEKPFSCSVCNYQCAYKESLDRHMRTHTGERPFACELCDCKFGHQSSLVRHTKTHTAVRFFPCTLCDFKSDRKSSIVNHMKAHEGKRATV